MSDSSLLYIILSALAGAIITQIFTSIKNRTITLYWEKYYQRLATSEVDPTWGDLKILYNGHEQKHLSFVSIRISNNSNRELDDMDIRIDCLDESQIALSRGFYDENGSPLYLTDEYKKRLQEFKDTDDVGYVMNYREYKVPVLNRDSSLTFDLLVSSMNNEQPNVRVSCVHKSVKMKYAEPRQKLLNEDLFYSSIIGIIITIVCATIFIFWDDYFSFNTAIIAITTMALSASIIGSLLIKTYKIFLKLF